MINLLPEKQQKDIYREYRRRKHTVALLLVSATLLLGVVLLLPSFGLSFYRSKAAVSVVLRQTQEGKDSQRKLNQKLVDAEQMVSLVRPEGKTKNPSQVFARVIELRGEGNTTTELSFSLLDDKKSAEVRVFGVAATRQSLRTFTSKLEKEPGVSDLDVPVSNFVKESDITFSFTFKIAL